MPGRITLRTFIKRVERMQMLADRSDEGRCQGLGWIPGDVRHFDSTGKTGDLPLPHMGWNQIEHDETHPLLKGIPSGSYFYFVHSYALEVTDATLATCGYGLPFTAIVGRDNFFGAQFHPERSGPAGARLLQNFLEL